MTAAPVTEPVTTVEPSADGQRLVAALAIPTRGGGFVRSDAPAGDIESAQ
jgi:hypothetical protein